MYILYLHHIFDLFLNLTQYFTKLFLAPKPKQEFCFDLIMYFKKWYTTEASYLVISLSSLRE